MARNAAFSSEIIYFADEIRDIFFKAPILERIAKGYSFVEGPVFKQSNQTLYFTDFPNETIHKWDAINGAEVFTNEGLRAIGLTLDESEQIIAAQSRLRRVAVVNELASEGIVDNIDGKKFNSINDVIVAKNGDILFTDPFSKMLEVESEIGINGVYWWHKLTRGVTVVNDEFSWPNGLCLSLDEEILYVNDTGENTIYKIKKDSTGNFGKREVFANVDPSYGDGAPDGMKVDKYGNVWVTGPGGVWIFDDLGIKQAIIKVPEFVGNFCFGGELRDEIYFAASKSVYKMKLPHAIY